MTVVAATVVVDVVVLAAVKVEVGWWRQSICKVRLVEHTRVELFDLCSAIGFHGSDPKKLNPA